MTIRITGDVEYMSGEHFEKIAMIKAFRAAWDLGLKDAKESVDLLQAKGTLHMELPFPSQTSLKDLARFRVRVLADTTALHTRLKNLVVAAVKAGEFELADELLSLCKKYCQT
jgi:hypothetical protein